MIKYPDYQNSILSVTSSVLKYYGVNTFHNTNKIVDKYLTSNPRNIILFVLDGMGVNMLDFLPKWSFFRKRHEDTISSIFPSTTVAATTTLKTGLSPAEHGRLGMLLYFDEVKDIVSVFNNKRISDGKVLDGIRLMDKYTPIEKMYTLIEKASPSVQAMEISQFSDFKCKSVDEVCTNALKIAGSEGKHFMYCYWDEPDRDAHIYGTSSIHVKYDVVDYDIKLKKLCERLPDDSLVIITADHGHIDTKWIDINDYPELNSMLERRPSVERRAVSFKVKSGMKNMFFEKFNSCFSDKFLLMSFEELLKTGILGDGELNSMCKEFIGDFMAISISDYSIALTSEDVKMKSCHAGITDKEMYVPLILFRN